MDSREMAGREAAAPPTRREDTAQPYPSAAAATRPEGVAEPTSKHSAVWDWLQNCPYIADLFFNHTQTDSGDTSLIPSDEIVSEYLDGSSLRNYNVTLTKVLPVSFEPNDTANIAQLVDFEALGDWVEAQNLARNFPNFPPGECVEEIRVLPSASGYMVAQDMRLAKYQLQFQIEYMREGR